MPTSTADLLLSFVCIPIRFPVHVAEAPGGQAQHVFYLPACSPQPPGSPCSRLSGSGSAHHLPHMALLLFCPQSRLETCCTWTKKDDGHFCQHAKSTFHVGSAWPAHTGHSKVILCVCFSGFWTSTSLFTLVVLCITVFICVSYTCFGHFKYLSPHNYVVSVSSCVTVLLLYVSLHNEASYCLCAFPGQRGG